MNIYINGELKTLNVGTELDCESLLKNIGLDKNGLVAEIDGKVYTVDKFSTAIIKEGSHVELIRIVGGG